MVTATISPRRANDAPWYIGIEPEPVTKAPPWSQTTTGRRASSGAGVQTLSVRQSSLGAATMLRPLVTALAACMACGPKRVASRRPVQDSGGWGGANRNGPSGGRAYGTPRKTTTPRSSSPWRLPYPVVTVVVVVVAIVNTSSARSALDCLVGDVVPGTRRG